MSGPLAYVNGSFLPADQATLPAYDAGFVLGVTVAEQLRTVGGSLFRLEQHLQRLRRSLEIVQLDLPVPLDQLACDARQLAAHNHRLLDPGDDLNLTLFVTPGAYYPLAPAEAAPQELMPRVMMHTRPLPFHLWSSLYDHGQPLIVSSVRQVPPNCWPAELKCRSRMHYYLADREARARDPAARALLLDQDGFVTEASTANVVVYRRGEGLQSPPQAKILPGISMGMLVELADRLGLPTVYRDLTVGDLLSANEVLLASTSPCVWPVVRLDGQPIGAGRPGPLFCQLIAAWGRQVGVDLLDQASRFRQRG